MGMLMIMIDPYNTYPSNPFVTNLKIVIQSMLNILLPNLFYASVFFYVIPKYVGVPYGKQPFKQFLDCTGLTWLKKIFLRKYIITIIFIIPSILIIYFIGQEISGVGSSYISNPEVMVISLTFFSFSLWQEILHRGIILTMLINNYSKIWSLIYQTSITIILKFFIYFFPFFSSFTLFNLPNISLFLFDIFCSSFISLIFGYVYLKIGSLLPGIISTFVLSIFLPFSFFVPFLPLSLFVYPYPTY